MTLPGRSQRLCLHLNISLPPLLNLILEYFDLQIMELVGIMSIQGFPLEYKLAAWTSSIHPPIQSQREFLQERMRASI
jgi:hypothetical protein